ncbi:hypothetical protein TNCV_3773181 [Trichonephila clavipes]|nr:hypothetical protein TNCV_3773181 [Trichonephila clavipes]
MASLDDQFLLATNVGRVDEEMASPSGRISQGFRITAESPPGTNFLRGPSVTSSHFGSPYPNPQNNVPIRSILIDDEDNSVEIPLAKRWKRYNPPATHVKAFILVIPGQKA